MRYALIGLLASSLLVTSCVGNGTAPTQAPATDSTVTDSSANSADYSESEYDTVYVVVLDTNQNYYLLQEKMYPLAASLGLVIDTMNRYYDLDKDRIVLNENDEDEMYRGVYFPRRTESATLSLEYYSLYDTSASEGNIALVAGLFYEQPGADSLLAIVRKEVPAAFMKPARMYMGCIH
ncbi:MAG: hypothetical protein IAE95_03990 [Chitinophagaceae bacterium]|nr:hypothetical protein [Chitinophagaceae bacterium]